MASRSLGLCLKPEQPQLAESVRELEKWLLDRGVEVVPDAEAGRYTEARGRGLVELGARVEAVIVLGGDGTLLAAARGLGARAVPILGVNLGTLGFLAETSRDELFASVEDLLAGRQRTELRMRLEVAVERAGVEREHYLGLNEAVVSGGLSRIIELEARADGAALASYRADGLIVATPTGSTAYSLSAGGPLLLPTLEALLVTPICPHTLTQRPLVLPGACEVEMRVRQARERDAHVTVDGQVGCALEDDDCVRVRRSPHPLPLLVPPDRNRFEVMRAKLRWGER